MRTRWLQVAHLRPGFRFMWAGHLVTFQRAEGPQGRRWWKADAVAHLRYPVRP